MLKFLPTFPSSKMSSIDQVQLGHNSDEDKGRAEKFGSHEHAISEKSKRVDIEVHTGNSHVSLCKVRQNDEILLRRETDVVKGQKVHNLELEKQNTKFSVSQGSGQKNHDNEVHVKKQCSKTPTSILKDIERNFLSSMCEIRRKDKMEVQNDLVEVLRSREKIYGKHLDPSWFSYSSDLGGIVKSNQEKNLARSMLVGAPLMVAQKGAQTLRKKLMEGDSQILQNLQMDTPTTLAQVLKQLQSVPPLTLLNLCNKEKGEFVIENLLQHSEDLDYVQDVLNIVGSHSELTPTLHAVLAGFNRRRTSGRFKQGHQSIVMDRLRFSHLASSNDDYGDSRPRRKKRTRFVSRACFYFQKREGCNNPKTCKFKHKCNICWSQSHGAAFCPEVRKRNRSSKIRRTHYSHKKDDFR